MAKVQKRKLCPICGKPTDDKIKPFCSKRCADVDLHRWLSGSYAIPVTEDEEEEPKIHASRTIINHVVNQGEAVLSSNAMTDKRFSSGKSVHAMSIRSALCVPIKARKLDGKGGDEVVGVIYIDSSAKNYTYAPDQLRLLTAIGLQAGMAIQNAKLYQQGLQAERLCCAPSS